MPNPPQPSAFIDFPPQNEKFRAEVSFLLFHYFLAFLLWYAAGMNNDTSLKCGLYEEIINQKLKEEIQQLHSSAIDVRQLDKAEAPKILSRYVSQRLEQRLRILSENSDTDVLDQVALANQMVEQIDGTEESSNSIAIPGEELLAISDPSRSVIRPSSSLADISLFTGGPLEP